MANVFRSQIILERAGINRETRALTVGFPIA